MNKKPVAWMNINVDVWGGKPTLSFDKDEFAEITTPLYTHPGNLTDEEIMEISVKFNFQGKPYLFPFVRAILRKAQEK